MGHSVTYQFTKSRSAASAPRSQLRAHACAKKPLRLLELNEGGWSQVNPGVQGGLRREDGGASEHVSG